MAGRFTGGARGRRVIKGSTAGGASLGDLRRDSASGAGGGGGGGGGGGTPTPESERTYRPGEQGGIGRGTWIPGQYDPTQSRTVGGAFTIAGRVNVPGGTVLVRAGDTMSEAIATGRGMIEQRQREQQSLVAMRASERVLAQSNANEAARQAAMNANRVAAEKKARTAFLAGERAPLAPVVTSPIATTPRPAVPAKTPAAAAKAKATTTARSASQAAAGRNTTGRRVAL